MLLPRCRTYWGALALLPLWLACEVVPATNGFDPSSASPFPGEVIGRVVIPGLDLSDREPLRLRVYDESGARIDGTSALPTLVTRVAGERVPEGLEGSAEGNDDAAGTFSATLPPGRYSLQFFPADNDLPTLRQATVRDIDVFPASRVSVVLAVDLVDAAELPGVISVTVEGVEEGAAADVALRPVGEVLGFTSRFERVLSDGEVRFTGVPPGEYQLLTTGEGYVPAAQRVEVLTETSAQVPAEVDVRVTSLGRFFRLRPAEGADPPYVRTFEAQLELAPLLLTQGEQVELRLFARRSDGLTLDDEGGGEWLPWEPPTGAVGDTVVVPLDDTDDADGPQQITAQLRLLLGDEVYPSRATQIDVIVDRAAPELLSLTLEAEQAEVALDSAGGALAPALLIGCDSFPGTTCPPLATTTKVEGFAQVSDAVGRVRDLAVTLDDEAEPTTWQPVTTTGSFAALQMASPPLAADDEGEHALRFWVRDAAGNVGLLATRTVLVDVTPPAATLTLGAPAASLAYATRADVSAWLSTEEQDLRYRLSNNALFEGPWLTLPSGGGPLEWRLGAATVDGPKTVFAALRDVVGNESVATAQVALDATAPEAPVFPTTELFRNGDNPDFDPGELAPDCPGGAPIPDGVGTELEWALLEVTWEPVADAVGYHVEVARDLAFNENLIETPLWTLEGGTFSNPQFEAYRCYFDAWFGPRSPYTTRTSVLLGHVTHPGTLLPQLFVEEHPRELQLYVRVSAEDAAGNRSSSVVSLLYDREPPAGTLVAPEARLAASGERFVADLSLTLRLDAEGAAHMKVINQSSGETFQEVSPSPVLSVFTHLLAPNGVHGNPPDPSPSDENKRVRVLLEDEAGNQTTLGVDVTLDDLPPTPPLLRVLPSSIDADEVTLDLEVPARDHHLRGYLLRAGGQDPVALSADDFPYVLSLPQDRVTRLSLRAVDEAGNASDEYLAALEEDSRRPARPTNVVPRAGNESIEVTWDLPVDSSGNRDDEDIAGYLVYYGTDGTTALPLGGVDADQGPSPVFTTNRGSLRLTGLPNAVTVYVNVTAVDEVWLNSSDEQVKAAHESPPDSNQPVPAQPGEIAPRLVHCSASDAFGTTSPLSVVLSEGVAYVGLGNGSGEVRAYDVSLPATPQLLGSVTLARLGNVHTLVKQGRFLYALVGNTQATSDNNGWAIIDTATMNVVHESGATRLATASINGIWVNGPSVILSVANSQGFFSPYRGWTEHYALGASLVADAATPVFLGSTSSHSTTDANYVANNKLRLGGPVTMRPDGTVFSLMGNALQPIRLVGGEMSTPRGCDTDPTDGLTCPSAFVLPTTDSGRSVHTRGTDVIGVFYGGVRAFDAQDPFSLSQKGAISLSSTGGRSVYANGILYVPTFGGGLDLVNVENPSLLRGLGTALFTCDDASFSDSGNYFDLSIERTLMALVANDSQGELRFAHVADPVRFTKLGSALVETTGQTTVRMAAGPDVLVVGGSNLLTAVYDTSSPGNIRRRQIFSGQNDWRMRDGVFLGPYLVSVGGTNTKWLRVLSFQDPDNVVDVAQLGGGCAGNCGPNAVAAADEFAYVALTESTGPVYTVRAVRLGDAIDRRSATVFDTGDLLGRVEFSSADDLPARLLAHRGRLYGLAKKGMKVMSLAPGTPTAFDGSTPLNGFRLLRDEQTDVSLGIGAGETPGPMTASGRYLFARWGSGVFTWDISDPDAPRHLRVTRGEPNLTQSGDESLYDFESVADLVFSGGYLFSGRSVFRLERLEDDVVRYTRIARRASGAAAGLAVHGPYLFAASDDAVEAYKME